MFEVGQVVKVKECLKAGIYHPSNKGNLLFHPFMKKYCGNRYKITNIALTTMHGTIYFLEDIENFVFSESMLTTHDSIKDKLKEKRLI